MANFQVTDQTTRQTQSLDGTPLRLGRVGLSDATRDDLSVTALSDNVDITTGPGNDVIMAKGGFNFINPGAGNNLLIGGTGQNAYAFSVPTAGTSHNLITNFHVGDTLHFDGVPQTGIAFQFLDVLSSIGPAWQIAVTPQATPTQPLITVDLPGFSSADFRDDQATTRLTFNNDILSVVR